MTTEEQLKEFIIGKYKSLRNFVNTSGIDVPYTTIDGIFKRGIKNSNVSTIIRLCKVLNISVDELANGNIVPVKEDIVFDYAKMLSMLSEQNRATAYRYIDYLVNLEKGGGKNDFIMETQERDEPEI